MTTNNKPALGPRPIFAIANEIIGHWIDIYYGALPYLKAMRNITTIDEMYGEDTARSIVCYFLSNAGRWRGEHARRLKAKLNALLK